VNLSPERKELLRKNLYLVETLDPTKEVTECRYQYENGTRCIAGACLTEAEIKYLIDTPFVGFNGTVNQENYNGRTIIEVNRKFKLLSEEDEKTLDELQKENDTIIQTFRENKEKRIAKLKEMVDSLLKD